MIRVCISLFVFAFSLCDTVSELKSKLPLLVTFASGSRSFNQFHYQDLSITADELLEPFLNLYPNFKESLVKDILLKDMSILAHSQLWLLEHSLDRRNFDFAAEQLPVVLNHMNRFILSSNPKTSETEDLTRQVIKQLANLKKLFSKKKSKEEIFNCGNSLIDKVQTLTFLSPQIEEILKGRKYIEKNAEDLHAQILTLWKAHERLYL